MSTQRGLTLAEVVLATAILLVLAMVALPVSRRAAIRARELELRHDLRVMRSAIDAYHVLAEQGLIEQEDVEQDNYPRDFDDLVEGVELVGDATGRKVKFLRRVPLDPITRSYEWGKRSTRDDPDSEIWGGENLWDVYCTSEALSLDGVTHYNEW